MTPRTTPAEPALPEPRFRAELPPELEGIPDEPTTTLDLDALDARLDAEDEA